MTFLGRNPLLEGYSVIDVVVLIAIPIALAAIAVGCFDRRDLNV